MQVSYATEGPDDDFELTDEESAIIEQALEMEEDLVYIPTDLAAAVAVRGCGHMHMRSSTACTSSGTVGAFCTLVQQVGAARWRPGSSSQLEGPQKHAMSS